MGERTGKSSLERMLPDVPYGSASSGVPASFYKCRISISEVKSILTLYVFIILLLVMLCTFSIITFLMDSRGKGVSDPIWSLQWAAYPITTEYIFYDSCQGPEYLCTSNLTDCNCACSVRKHLFGDGCVACFLEARNKCRKRMGDVYVCFH